MHCASFSISPNDLWNLIGSAHAPQVIDVRCRDVYDAADGILPTAAWRDFATVAEWSKELDRTRPVVLSCKQGKELSQAPTAYLRGEGFAASILSGGYSAWRDAGLPLVSKTALARFASTRPQARRRVGGDHRGGRRRGSQSLGLVCTSRAVRQGQEQHVGWLRWFAFDPLTLDLKVTALAAIAAVLAFVLHRGLIELVVLMAGLGIVTRLVFGA